MPTTLGQVAAILYGTTPPGNTKVLWGKEDGSGNVLGFFRYDLTLGQWVPYKVVVRSTNPPINTDVVWLDANFPAPMPKTYNSGSGNWEFIFQLSRRAENADITLQETDNNTVIDFTNSGGAAVIELQDIEVNDFQCTIARLGDGQVYIVTNDTLLNGQSGSFELKFQYTQVVIRRYAPNEYIVSGNLN